MIELTYPAEALDAAARDELVARLTDTVTDWEGMEESSRVRSTIWTFVDERPGESLYVGGTRADRPHYRVRITVAEGTLDPERKAGLVSDVTALVLAAEGSPNEPRGAARVWCHVVELAEGGWGAAGRIWGLADIVEFAGLPAPASTS
jgi:phenylpyruvate tautomerase PptA (4-oxalocrotonate tautomerase family)